MKRLLFALMLFISLSAYSQIINFPDANFKAGLIAAGVDTNNDGDITQAEAAVVLSLIGMNNRNISDATGIEFFTNLRALFISSNSLTSIDLSSNILLNSIDVGNNSLTNLLLPNNNLFVDFRCQNNNLTGSLDLSAHTSLQVLECSNNNFTNLSVTSTALTFLNCNNNNLTSLNIPGNSTLRDLRCALNSITALDVSGSTGLQTLVCSTNALTSLNLANGNNTILTAFNTTVNPNLSCIQVDDVAAANVNPNWLKDATASYTLGCPIINFPDPNMKAAVIAAGVDTNNDGEIQFNEALIPTTLNLSNQNITDATGIEFFTSLTTLNLAGNSITSINVSSNILLENFAISSNNLSSLDVSANTLLRTLGCETNSISSLNIGTNTSLETLFCGFNDLTSLDISSNPALIRLECNDNSLTSIDASNNSNLEFLYCWENSLTSLIVSSNNTSLNSIYCYDNNLTSLDVTLVPGLLELDCRRNSITSLDVSSSTALRELSCENNLITVIDVSSSPNIQNLTCNNNNLTQLDIKTGNTAATNLFLDARINPNLECINVDDAAAADVNPRFFKDATASYSENCGPVVTILNAPTSTSSSFTVTFSIDRDVTGFDVSDIVLANATASDFTATSGPDEYTALITPTSLCAIDITIDVPASAMQDVSNRPNAAAAQVVVATVDNVSPTVVGQDITIQLDATGQATITGTDIDNGSTDNCGIASLTPDKTAFTCADLGVNEVVLTVTDTNNNTNTNTVAVTVEDNIAPVAAAQNITVQLATNGQITITGADLDNGSSDNCSVSLSLSQSIFDCSNLGANTVTLTVTDPSGNTDTATTVVTVEDNQPLTAIAQNITVQLDANGQATITPQDVDNGSGSGCGNISLSLDTTSFDCSNIGQNTVTLTVTEGPNTETATAIVTVEDTVLPTVVTQDISVQLDTNGQATITASDIDNGSADNCGIATQILDVTSFDCSNIGANTVTLTVTDNQGNVGTGTATVTVSEAVAPTAIAQDLTIQLDANGQASITAGQIDNGSTDNCAIANLSLDTTDFDCTDLGQNTVTLTVVDASGNTATATAVVTVEDNSVPTTTAQDITIQLDTNGSVTIQAADLDNGSTDNCTLTFTADTTTFDCSNLGTNTVTLTAMDGAGNTATATATVTVEDTLSPTVITQDITVTLDANGDATITTTDIDNGSTDNCTAMADLTYSLDTTTFDCSNLGSNTVTLTVTDAEGNISTGTATVTVTEDVAPTVVTQDITVSLDANGQASITAADIDNGSTDDCSGIASRSLDITDFDCPGLGDVTVTLIVTDNEGNTATGTATVTITATDEDNNGIADDCESRAIVTPQGFSPNGDTINDTWVIENIDDFPNNTVTVYNRWGQKVFEASNYQNDWDGISSEAGGNKRLPAGSYLYVIELNDADFPPKQGWIYINY